MTNHPCDQFTHQLQQCALLSMDCLPIFINFKTNLIDMSTKCVYVHCSISCCRSRLLQIILIKASEGIIHTHSACVLPSSVFSDVTRLSLVKIKSYHISRGKWTINIVFNGFFSILFFFIERFHLKLQTL